MWAGNTGYLLEKWREYGFHELLKEAYQKGVLLAGISAGAMCWFEKCYSENTENDFEEWNGLGLLSGTYCPHYNDQERRWAFDCWIENHPTLQAYTLIDTETLHFRNEKLVAKIQTY